MSDKRDASKAGRRRSDQAVNRMGAAIDRLTIELAVLRATIDAATEAAGTNPPGPAADPAEAAELEATLALEKLAVEQDLDLRTSFHTKLMEVAGAAIDRAKESAKFVQTAAVALTVAYVSLLGVVFSANGKPLPPRGLYAAVFLGLAVALAVAYLAFLRQTPATESYRPMATLMQTQMAQTATFIDWVNSSVRNRRSVLRASVVAIAVGVVLMPAPFIGATGSSSTAAAGGSTTTTTAAPTTTTAPPVTIARVAPPTVPLAVPPQMAATATKVFQAQAEAYLKQLAADQKARDAAAKAAAAPTTTAPAPPTAIVVAPPKACRGIGSSFAPCAFKTEVGVERAFRRMALLGLLLVLLIPLIFLGLDRLAADRARKAAESA